MAGPTLEPKDPLSWAPTASKGVLSHPLELWRLALWVEGDHVKESGEKRGSTSRPLGLPRHLRWLLGVRPPFPESRGTRRSLWDVHADGASDPCVGCPCAAGAIALWARGQQGPPGSRQW